MALRAVLDTSVLVPLFTADALNVRAFAILENSDAAFIVSDFAALEFVSACTFKIRVGSLTAAEAVMARESLSDWRAKFTEDTLLSSADIAVAQSYLERFDLNLRAPDALHIAIASRLNAALITFDAKMAAAAQALGLKVTG